MDSSHPPLDFPFYGLAADEPGPRWLASVDGPLGRRPEGVWLRHGSGIARDAREAWVRVQTQRSDRLRLRDPESATASSTAFFLIDATLPEDEHLEDYKDRATVFADGLGKRHAEWRRVTWTVDGRQVVATVADFAGVWAGFTTELPGVEVVVVAHRVDADGLELTEVVDSSSYHFDSTRPTLFPETLEQSWAAAGIDRDAGLDVWWPTHPDHAQV